MQRRPSGQPASMGVAHELWVGLPRSRGDFGSIALSVCFWLLPGVDRSALYAWLLEHVFGGRAFAWHWSTMLLQVGVFGAGVIVSYTLYALLPYSAWVRSLRVPRPDTPLPWHSDAADTLKELGATASSAVVPAAGGAGGSERTLIDAEAREAAAYRAHSRAERAKSYSALQWRAATYTTCFFGVNALLTYLFFHKPKCLLEPEQMSPRSTVVVQVLMFCVFADFLQYWTHRAAHTRWLYWCHKMHHEFQDTTVWASVYEHPANLFLVVLLPVGLCFGLCNRMGYPLHLFTVWQITIAGQLAGVLDHCGLSASARDDTWNSWGWCASGVLPLCRQALYHDLHHRQFQYNFGGRYVLFDRLFGTYKAPPPFGPADPKTAPAKAA